MTTYLSPRSNLPQILATFEKKFSARMTCPKHVRDRATRQKNAVNQSVRMLLQSRKTIGESPPRVMLFWIKQSEHSTARMAGTVSSENSPPCIRMR